MNASNYSKQAKLVVGNASFSTGEAVVVGMVMTLLSLLIIFGNALVIFVYVKNRCLQRPKNYFILSLAIADVLIGIFSVNFYTVYLLHGYWPLGYVACNLWLSMDYSCCQASTLGLLAISVDRFLSIRNAVFHRNNFTKHRLKKIIVCLWLLSFLLWFGSVFLYPVLYGKRTTKEGVCHIQFLYENSTMTIITAFFNFYGPIIIMTAIYVLISVHLIRRYQHIRRRNITLKEKQQSQESLTSNSCSLDAILDSSPSFSKNQHPKIVIEKDLDTEYTNTEFIRIHHNSSKDSIRMLSNSNSRLGISQAATPTGTPSSSPLPPGKYTHVRKRSTQTQKQYLAHKRAVTLLLLVILAFAVTWLPYNLMAVIWPFCKSCIVASWWDFGYIFCYVNSLLNPLCYAFGNRQFKKYFKKAFKDLKQGLREMFLNIKI